MATTTATSGEPLVGNKREPAGYPIALRQGNNRRGGLYLLYAPTPSNDRCDTLWDAYRCFGQSSVFHWDTQMSQWAGRTTLSHWPGVTVGHWQFLLSPMTDGSLVRNAIANMLTTPLLNPSGFNAGLGSLAMSRIWFPFKVHRTLLERGSCPSHHSF